jgi:hypothetical protein
MALAQTRSCLQCAAQFEIKKVNQRFCNDKCKNTYNVQGLIAQLQRITFTIAQTAVTTGLTEAAVRSRIRRYNVQTFNLGRVYIRRSDARQIAAHGRRAK